MYDSNENLYTFHVPHTQTEDKYFGMAWMLWGRSKVADLFSKIF